MVHIKTLQKEVADKLKRNEASYRAALAGSKYPLLSSYECSVASHHGLRGISSCHSGQLPKKLALATTVPKEFNFSTDGRVKAGTASTHREVDFTAQLRKHPSSPVSC